MDKIPAGFKDSNKKENVEENEKDQDEDINKEFFN
jgi:hypothetical protein